MIIYKITNKLNAKIYIGQTIQSLAERWSGHSRPHRGKHKARSAIANAIQLYGKENFIIEQIDSASSIEELNELEQKYIYRFNTLCPNGYNLELGGENKECHPDTKAKISNTLKGRPIKNRMNGAPKGRKVSESRKAQISATMTGVPQPWKHKKVICLETGDIYESVNAAAKALGIARPNLSQILKSGRKHRKLGLTFKFY